MKIKLHFFSIIFSVIFIFNDINGQPLPKKQVTENDLNEIHFKKIPKVDSSIVKYFLFCKPYFAEIPYDRIKIKKKKQLIPLTTVPNPLNLFRFKKNWSYAIKISTKTIPILTPILFDSLSLEGKLGVLAHELSHVSDFHNHTRGYLIKAFFWHLNPRKIDIFEYNTDFICINHGMGYQLLAWSMDTSILNGKGTMKPPFKNERYMFPATIKNFIEKSSIYK